jgi:hypothetical protein
MKGGFMGRSAEFKGSSFPADAKPTKIYTYPAVADRVGLPDLTFRKKRGESAPLPLFTAGKESLFKKNTTVSNKVKTLCDLQLMTLLGSVWPDEAGLDITVNIIARRAAVLNVKQDGNNVVIDAHWNLFVPYFYQIEELPIVHPEVLDIFAEAVFSYAAVAIRHPEATRKELRSLVIDAYSDEPQFLLASLDVFNKPSVYHIHPARIWFTGFSAANDDRRLEIDDLASTPLPVSPEFLEEVADFIHQVAKNYAFR